MSDKQDAARWRYTQEEGYFVCGPYNQYGEFLGYTVGIQKKGVSVNRSKQGEGATLEVAIDMALKK